MWYVSGNRDDEVIEQPERLHHRPRASAPAPLVRLRHPPLRRQPPGRTAAADHLGRDPEALPDDRGGGRAQARLLDLREGLRTSRRRDPEAELLPSKRMTSEHAECRGADTEDAMADGNITKDAMYDAVRARRLRVDAGARPLRRTARPRSTRSSRRPTTTSGIRSTRSTSTSTSRSTWRTRR